MKEKLEKALGILGILLAAPVILGLYLIWAIFGGDTKYLDEIVDKPMELLVIILVTYGLVALYLISPPLYLPPNLAIIALFLGIGGPIIFVCCVVIYARKKDRKTESIHRDFFAERKKREASMRETTFSELGYDWMELKEQLGRGAINQKEYEQKKELLEALLELNNN